MLSAIMLSVIMRATFLQYYAYCRYSECRYVTWCPLRQFKSRDHFRAKTVDPVKEIKK
jgi:hypothetical protein